MGNNHKVIGIHSVTLLVFVGLLSYFGNCAPVGHATGPSDKESDKSPAPVPNFDEEQQLKDLKQSLGKTFSILKSQSSVQYTDQNQNQESHVERKEEANEDGHLVARLTQKIDSVGPSNGVANVTPGSHVRTEVEIPSQGVHEVVEDQLPHGHGQREIADTVERRSPHEPANPANPAISNQIDGKYTSFSGVQYSPRDMAEYVFWTGDEKGVTLAIEEFLEDGLMTRKDAISFLREIKTNLDDLQLHYSRQQRFQKQPEPDETEAQQAQQGKENGGSSQRSLNKKIASDKNIVDAKLSKDISADKKNSRTFPPADSMQDDQEVSMGQLQQNRENRENREISDEDYEELLDRLKVADFLYTEYSLEEVIYQLAKVIFSQSLTKGSLEAQEALQKFTNFLESEAEKGHISKSLEKKVLDVLIASFADTIAEHPDLVVKSRPREVHQQTQSPSANQLLHQLAMLHPSATDSSLKVANPELGLGRTNPQVKYLVHESQGAQGSKPKHASE